MLNGHKKARGTQIFKIEKVFLKFPKEENSYRYIHKNSVEISGIIRNMALGNQKNSYDFKSLNFTNI